MDADLFFDLDAPLPAPQRRWRILLRGITARLKWPTWLATLKARLALGGFLALLLGVSATAWQLSARAEHDLLRQAHEREQREVHRTATSVNRHLQELQRLLGTLASQVDASLLDEPLLAAQLLDRSTLAVHFSNVYVARPDGRMVALLDSAGARYPGTSLADRDYFQRMLATLKPVISAPVEGRISGEPVVIFAYPVIQRGQVLAVIGGALRLASRNLLDDLHVTVEAEDQALLVLTDSNGVLLAHPQRGRITKSLADEPRLAAAFAKWRARGPSAAGDSQALAVDGQIVTTAGESIGGWQVWRAVPVAGLLAPVRDARNLAMRDAAVLAIGLALALAVVLHWQFRPLARLERRASALLAGDDTGAWPVASGEIGRLTRTLQHVWAERTQMESFNAQVLQKLGSVMSAAPVGLAFTREQRFELVSAEFCRLLGHAEGAILGQRTQVIFASNEDYAALGPQVGEAFGRGEPYSGEWQMLRADGNCFWGLLRARPVSQGDASAGTIWSINDVSDQVQARRVLEHAAHHDALTGVVNRQGFELVLQSLFDAQPMSRPAALVMLDLDHFKPINDTAGHAAGDAMLVAVAQAIASHVRSTDVVVRLGGDEFALLLPRCTHERAVSVAEKVREAITDLALTWEAHTLRVGASLGVCELAEHHESPAQWLAQADAACYEAKRMGRGRVRMSRPALRVMGGAVTDA
jgi:diguanylate cyclase (GGDEF)-like protein/PAS domain S-box-containing protein